MPSRTSTHPPSVIFLSSACFPPSCTHLRRTPRPVPAELFLQAPRRACVHTAAHRSIHADAQTTSRSRYPGSTRAYIQWLAIIQVELIVGFLPKSQFPQPACLPACPVASGVESPSPASAPGLPRSATLRPAPPAVLQGVQHPSKARQGAPHTGANTTGDDEEERRPRACVTVSPSFWFRRGEDTPSRVEARQGPRANTKKKEGEGHRVAGKSGH